MRAHPGWHIRWTRGNGLHLSWRQGWSTECFLNFSLQMSPCRTMQSWIPWRSSSTGMFGGFQKIIPGIWPNLFVASRGLSWWPCENQVNSKLQPKTCTPTLGPAVFDLENPGGENRNGLRIFSSQVADAMVQAAGEAPARLGQRATAPWNEHIPWKWMVGRWSFPFWYVPFSGANMFLFGGRVLSVYFF